MVVLNEKDEWTSSDWPPLQTAHSIRILKIKQTDNDGVLDIHLRVVDLDATPSYKCLSYTWGSPYMNDDGVYAGHRVLCNNKWIRIGHSLFDALSTLTMINEQHTADIWVDKISINQDDDLERSQQVALMGRIYRNATKVIAWLGPADADTTIAIDVIKALARADTEKAKLYSRPEHADSDRPGLDAALTNESLYSEFGLPYINLKDWQSYINLLSRSYFNRAWTLSESWLARKLDLYCGIHHISFDTLIDHHVNMHNLPWDHWAGKQRPLSDFGRLQRQSGNQVYLGCRHQINIIKNYRAQTRGPPSVHPINILGSIEMCQDNIGHANRGRYASDPRDLIFSTLAMSMHTGLVPDYSKTVRDTFIRTARYLEEKSSAFGTDHIEDHSFRRLYDLPSWIADYTSILRPGAFHSKGGHYNASGTLPKAIFSDTEPEILAVQGMRIDVVASTAGTHEELLKGGAILRYLDLVSRLPPTYKNGENRVEAFWKALVAGRTGSGPRPPDSSWRPLVHDALMMLIIYYGVKAIQQAREGPVPGSTAYPSSLTDDPRLESLITNVQAITITDDTNVMPSPAEIDEFWSQHSQALQEAVVTTDGTHTLFNIFPKSWTFYDALGSFLPDRRLFRTETGYIGIAGLSIQAGDEVILVQGSGEPWVMRRRPDSEPQRYQFVAGAYLHGIMNGELVDDLLENGARIEID